MNANLTGPLKILVVTAMYPHPGNEGFGAFVMQQVEQLQELAAAGSLNEALIPAAQLLPEFPSEYVDDITEGQIRQGRDFPSMPR